MITPFLALLQFATTLMLNFRHGRYIFPKQTQLCTILRSEMDVKILLGREELISSIAGPWIFRENMCMTKSIQTAHFESPILSLSILDIYLPLFT